MEFFVENFPEGPPKERGGAGKDLSGRGRRALATARFKIATALESPAAPPLIFGGTPAGATSQYQAGLEW